MDKKINSYIFITMEGYTYQPGSESVEPDISNCQAIGFADGVNEREAFGSLVSENGYLLGTTFDQIKCYELKHKADEKFVHYFYLSEWKNSSANPFICKNGIRILSEEEAEKIIDECLTCHYCNEPFKECDRIVCGLGCIDGAVDVVEYLGKYWHRGCIDDSLVVP